MQRKPEVWTIRELTKNFCQSPMNSVFQALAGQKISLEIMQDWKDWRIR